MITPTEKRLQELENKAAIFLAQSMDQKGKIEDVGALKNEIADLKKSIDDLSKKLSSDSSLHSQKIAQNDLDISKLSPQVSRFASEVNDVKKSAENLNLSLALTNKNFLDISSEVKKIVDDMTQDKHQKEEINKIINNYLVNHNSLRQDVQSIRNELKTDISNSFSDVKGMTENLGKKLEDHEGKINGLDNSNVSLMCDVERKLASIEKKIIPQDNSQIETLQSGLNELRSSLSTLRSSVDSISSKIIDQDKLNTKLKVLENSIAQLYEFIKKQELKG